MGQLLEDFDSFDEVPRISEATGRDVNMLDVRQGDLFPERPLEQPGQRIIADREGEELGRSTGGGRGNQRPLPRLAEPPSVHQLPDVAGMLPRGIHICQ